jgi:DNA mismatch repair protein MutL
MLFVNGRMIHSPILSLPLREACDGTLAKGLHPPAVLFFEMDPAAVDCNVHPAKREVRFRDPALLRSVALMAARSAWATAAPSLTNFPSSTPVTSPWKPSEFSHQQEFMRTSTDSTYDVEPSDFRDSARVSELPSLLTSRAARFIGVLGIRYLLFEDEESLLLVEIRAARERVLYEQCVSRLRLGELESQHLLLPEVLEMSSADLAWIEAHRDLLHAAGLVAEVFGGKSLKVDAIPSAAASLPVAKIVAGLVDDLRKISESPSLDSLPREALAASVSRLAAAGARLPAGEVAAQMLLRELLSCELPYVTPGGRPTMNQISPGELQRRFTA